MKASNRVIINTGILYGNMVVNAVIALVSTKWILSSLGQVDFGIYNLVGGMIAMFSFLNVAMTAATQRFLAYSMGKEERDIIQDTFKCSVILHIIIGLIVLLIFEVMGDYFMHHKLEIPDHRINEAMIVLHCLSISTFFTIITVPYQAILSAKENMLSIALLNIYESIMKLVIAFILLHFLGDRLVLYAVLMMGLYMSSMVINRIFCRKKYKWETKINWKSKIDFSLFRQMFSFAGWSFIGAISSLLRNQGLAMLMNTFFGVIINAAYGLATQVNGQAQVFSRTIIRAIQPQIMKSEGAGDRERMIKLTLTSCKIPFLILSLLVAPLLAEMPFILKLWLDDVPANTVIFCRIILVITLWTQIRLGLCIAIDSVGRVKWYQIICGCVHIFVIPVAYFLYRKGFSAAVGLVVVLIDEILTIFITAIFSKYLAGFNLKNYFFRLVVPCSVVVILLYIVSDYAISFFTNDWIRLIVFMAVYAPILCVVGYKYLLTNFERQIFRSSINTFVNKFYRR